MYRRHHVLMLVVSIIALFGMAPGIPIVTGYSGAPGTSGTCASSCHGTSGGTITVTGFPTIYTPGQTYTVTVRHSSGSSIANFNCSIRTGTGSNNAGTITAGLNTETYNVTGETNGVHFTSRDRDSGNFTWTAPNTGTGTCRLYLGGLQGTTTGQNSTIVQVTYEAAHDVGVIAILAPTDTIDSNATVTPACSVYNYGDQAESYRVRLKVGGYYDDTARVTSHAPGASVYMTFPSLSTWPRGTYAVTCSTELAGDATPANDKVTDTVAVRVHDVGCLSLTVPPDTVDSGTTVAPACSVYNYGTVPETYLVRMRIGSFYSDSVTVTTHPAGSALQVGFRDWIVTEVGGPYAVVCSTGLASDMDDGNDEQTGSVLVTQPVRDVAVLQILAPVDTVDTAAIVVPAALVRNLGEVQETFAVRFLIGGFYSADTVLTLPAGGTDTVRFADWTAAEVGTHVVKCSTMLAGDQDADNDRGQDSVTVLGAGIEASAPVPVRFALAGGVPSPFRHRTVIGFAIPRRTHVVLNIYSASGALVKVLSKSYLAPARYSMAWDGRDSRGRNIAPGVYYCRMRADEYLATRKLLKAE
jgi:hypothetical protein